MNIICFWSMKGSEIFMSKEEAHALKVYNLYDLYSKLPAENREQLYKQITSLEENANNVRLSHQFVRQNAC